MIPARPVVLVVDDDPAIADLLVEVLESEGYAVGTAASGAAGRIRIEAGGIDLVLLDRILPDMDGLELCRWVRARGGSGAVPIILLTVVTESEPGQAGFAIEADDYLSKPFELNELLHRVRTCLHRYSSPGGLTASPN